jgi:D-amino-acid oxidase
VAAAIWYPYKASPEDRIVGWGKRAFDVFEDLSHNSETGIRMREGVELHREPAPPPFWASAVPGVRRCEPRELPPGRRDGYAFAVPVIEMPLYLRYLVGRFEASGGTIEERSVSSIEEAVPGARAVVNCAGLGARELVGDESTHPIRGQIVRVRNPGLTDFILDDENPEGVTYIIPRSEDCILGGTAEDGVWEVDPDPEIAKGILSRCAALEPRLKGAEVLEHKAGLRPGRREVRLEVEELAGGQPCIHNYGHGGAGVTLSWGCAEEVVGLVREVFRGPSEPRRY